MSVDLTKPIFNDEDKAREHLEAQRWPNGPFCPHCGEAENVHRLEGKSHRPGLIQCNSCLQTFTVTVGSVMERSHIPLRKWVLAFYLLNASKKGMSAHQLHRMLGITYKSAWFLAHRVREAMRDATPAPMGNTGGAMQADETYYGNTSKRAKGYKKGHSHKSSVVALVDGDTGKARAFAIKGSTTADDVSTILKTNVRRTSRGGVAQPRPAPHRPAIPRYTPRNIGAHGPRDRTKGEYREQGQGDPSPHTAFRPNRGWGRQLAFRTN